MKQTRRLHLFRNTMLAALVIAVMKISDASAQPAANEGEKNPQGRHQDLMQQLNLTQEQQTRLSAYRQENRAKKQKTMEKMREARTHLREEISKPASDPKKIETLKGEVKALQGQMLDEQVESILKTKEILTPEQFRELEKKAKERRQSFKEKHGEFKARGQEF